jgi:hypothetical protein
MEECQSEWLSDLRRVVERAEREKVLETVSGDFGNDLYCFV